MLKTSIIKSILTVTLLMLPISTFAFSTKAPYAVLVDVKTDAVLYTKNADIQVPPSSMSKLMSVYLAFNALSQNTISMDDIFTVTEEAWKVGGSTMFLEPNDKVSVKDLLRGTIIHSGNDSCFTLATGLAGTEQRFVDQMNNMAKKIGLRNSHFTNATGMPDERHYMSINDIAILSKKLISDFPDLYHMFSEKEFSYHNITQPNRNYLVGEHGIDGLKTGHTERVGYGIAVSAQQGDRRLIAVVNGLSSESERLDEAKKLILHGFDSFENYHIASANKPIANIDVWHG
ncbi:MAG: D-alanyl-D-alanine carboxypeptidase family protein, partial [Alphaproteobacteria bacterium]